MDSGNTEKTGRETVHENNDKKEYENSEENGENEENNDSGEHNYLDIPLKEDQEVVTINLDTDLPDDPTELCDLLENEDANEHYWLTIMSAYSKLNKVDEAIEVITRGLNFYNEKNEKGQDFLKSCALFHTTLSWLYMKKSRSCPKVFIQGNQSNNYGNNYKNNNNNNYNNNNSNGDEKTKEYYQQLATQSLNQSMKLDRSLKFISLTSGVWSILNSNGDLNILDQASKMFEDILRKSNNRNLLALAGKARILYGKKNYKLALKIYQNILLSRPNFNPDPRIGIGLCFWQLGFYEKAKLAWERSREIAKKKNLPISSSPQYKSSTLFLGIYYLKKAFLNVFDNDFLQTYAKGIKLIEQVSKPGCKSPLASIWLASYLFSKKDMPTLQKVTQKIIEYAEMPSLKAEGYYWMGRAHHYLGEYDKAMNFYQASRNERSDYIPPKLGRAQLLMIADDMTQAKLALENIIQEHPKCNQAILILGSIYANEAIEKENASFALSSSSSSFLSSSSAVASIVKPPEEAANDLKKAKPLLNRFVTLSRDRVQKGKKNIELHSPEEVDALLLLAQLNEKDDIEASINSLQQALGIAKDSKRKIFPQLYNNMGVYYYHLGNYTSAGEMFQKALSEISEQSKINTEKKNEAIDENKDESENKNDNDSSDNVNTSSDDSENFKDMLVTIKYNIARLTEEIGSTSSTSEAISSAISQYKDIDRIASGYLDARIRICYLELRRGSPESGLMLQSLIDNDTENFAVRALFGWYLNRSRRTPITIKTLEHDVEARHLKHTLQRYDKHDLYSLTQMGNLFLAIGRELRPNSKEDLLARQSHYRRAVEFFDKTLQYDSKCAHAAQGIGIALAEERQFSKAIGIFSKVRETIKDPSVHINMGHCLVELKQYPRAIESYEAALKVRGNKDGQLLTCIGRAWYFVGITKSDVDALKKSLSYALKALELNKTVPQLIFNTAFLRFQIAEQVRRKRESERTVKDIENALEGLEHGILAFEQLSKAPNPPYPPADLMQRVTMGRNTTTKQLLRALESQKVFEASSEAKLSEARRLREEEAAKKAEAERIKREEEEQKQAAIALERAKLQEEAIKWAAIAAEQAEKYEAEASSRRQKASSRKGESKAAAKKRRKREAAENGEIMSSSDEESMYERDNRNRYLSGSESDVDSNNGLFEEEEEEAIMTDNETRKDRGDSKGKKKHKHKSKSKTRNGSLDNDITNEDKEKKLKRKLKKQRSGSTSGDNGITEAERQSKKRRLSRKSFLSEEKVVDSDDSGLEGDDFGEEDDGLASENNTFENGNTEPGQVKRSTSNRKVIDEFDDDD